MNDKTQIELIAKIVRDWILDNDIVHGDSIKALCQIAEVLQLNSYGEHVPNQVGSLK